MAGRGAVYGRRKHYLCLMIAFSTMCRRAASRIIKNILPLCGGILLSLLLLVVLLFAAVYLPPVQDFLTKRIAAAASESTGMTIGIDRVRLVFPLDLSVEGVTVLKPDTAFPDERDTIAKIEQVSIDIQKLPLFRGKVNVDGFLIRNALLDTDGLVAQARVRGSIGELRLQSHGINLLREEAMVDELLLSGVHADIQLADTAAADTAKQDNLWKIKADKIVIVNSGIAFHSAGDSLSVCANITDADIGHVCADLHSGLYEIGTFRLNAKELRYDKPLEPFAGDFDYNHITLNDISFCADSVSYSDTAVNVHSLGIRTANSSLSLSANMALDAFSDTDPGDLSLSAQAEIGKPDLMILFAGLPEEF